MDGSGGGDDSIFYNCRLQIQTEQTDGEVTCFSKLSLPAGSHCPHAITQC
jgi:hypothetical protein